VVILVSAAVLVLIGRGLGLLGGGDEADDEASRAPTKPRFVGGDRAPTALPQPAPATDAAPAPRPAAETVAAPTVLPAAAPAERPAPAPVAPPVAATGPGIEADRFASLRSLVTARTASGDVGEALAAIERAAALPLSAAQAAELHTLRAAAERAGEDAIGWIGKNVHGGGVLAARAQAQNLVGAEAKALQSRLLTSLGLPARADATAMPAADTAPWPVPRALPKDRVVRTVLAGKEVSGRVVDSRSDEVTLRIKDGDAVTFPTVRVVACEPTDVAAAEAVELGLAALHAKDALLARLWLACARARGGDPNDVRAARLAELLK